MHFFIKLMFFLPEGQELVIIFSSVLMTLVEWSEHWTSIVKAQVRLQSSYVVHELFLTVPQNVYDFHSRLKHKKTIKIACFLFTFDVSMSRSSFN